MSSEAIAAFIGKWRARWPEWAVAEAFVPSPQRSVLPPWFALLQELTDAAWAGEDPRPGEAKLGWWAEELSGWARGRHRHPLGAPLHALEAPWLELAAALPALRDSRATPRDAAEALAQVADFANAVAAVEATLFDSADASPDPAARASAAEVVARCLLGERLATAHDPGVPMQARAGHPADAAGARRHWARQLAAQAAPAPQAPRPRRIQQALLRARLRRDDPATPLPPWQALGGAWRGARN